MREQLEYVHSLWERIIAREHEVPVPPAHDAELRRRLSDHEADPAGARSASDAEMSLRDALAQRRKVVEVRRMARLPLFFVLVVVLLGCEIARSDGLASTRSADPADGVHALGPAAETSFPSCMLKLAEYEAKVKVSIRLQYRLPEPDTQDLVRDAMMRVCLRNESTPVRRHEAALRTAAHNAAKDGWRHNRRHPRCPVDEALPACPAASEPLARFEQELEIVEEALCKEDGATARIIRLRAQEDLDFPSIGRQLGITSDEARTRFHNGIRRVGKRVSGGGRGNAPPSK